ncbi:MAG: hypothetical protein ACFFCQ_10140 [Promethearchaeota archaeon]
MQIEKLSSFQLIIGIVCLFLIVSFHFTPSFAKHENLTELTTRKVPMGAISYNLNSSLTSLQFRTEDFHPGITHIGRYNIHIQVLVWVASSESNSDVLVRNLWNACQPIWTISHEELWHQVKDYYYHRPTISDPDFSVSIELANPSRIVEGWIMVNFIEDGVTIPPTNYTMPQSLCSDTSIGETSSSISTGVKRINFPAIFSVIGILASFFYKKRQI